MFEHMPPVSEVDVLVSPDAAAAELATSAPRGADTAALLLLDVDALSDTGRVDLLVAFERHIAMLQAAQQRVLASPDGRALDWSGTRLVDYTREQVGAALRLSPGHRGTTAVCGPHPGGAAARHPELLRTGHVTYLHAIKLAEAVNPFDDQTTATIEHGYYPGPPTRPSRSSPRRCGRCPVPTSPLSAERLTRRPRLLRHAPSARQHPPPGTPRPG